MLTPRPLLQTLRVSVQVDRKGVTVTLYCPTLIRVLGGLMVESPTIVKTTSLYIQISWCDHIIFVVRTHRIISTSGGEFETSSTNILTTFEVDRLLHTSGSEDTKSKRFVFKSFVNFDFTFFDDPGVDQNCDIYPGCHKNPLGVGCPMLGSGWCLTYRPAVRCPTLEAVGILYTVGFDIQVVEDVNQLTYHILPSHTVLIVVAFDIQVVEDFNQLTYRNIMRTYTDIHIIPVSQYVTLTNVILDIELTT